MPQRLGLKRADFYRAKSHTAHGGARGDLVLIIIEARGHFQVRYLSFQSNFRKKELPYFCDFEFSELKLQILSVSVHTTAFFYLLLNVCEPLTWKTAVLGVRCKIDNNQLYIRIRLTNGPSKKGVSLDQIKIARNKSRKNIWPS